MKLFSILRPAFAGLMFLLFAGSIWADGTVTHLSGPVSIKKMDGKTVVAEKGSKVHAGDTLATGAGGYVRMTMTDGGEMVLRPNSQLKVENYKYEQAKPTEDSFVFSMVKGGMRTITGLIGKRGNKDAYKLDTATATLGIRGTQFDLRVCLADCGTLADGTFLAVRFGSVQIANAEGNLVVTAGQVAYAAQEQSPVLLPRNPGIGFTPPPIIPKLDEKAKDIAAAAAAALLEQELPVIRGTAQVAMLAKQASPDAAPAQTEATPVDTSVMECTVQ